MDVLDLTRQLVAIDSQNPGPFEPEIVRFLEELAGSLGFETEVLEPTAGRPNLLITLGGAGTGAEGSQGSGHLVLSGHLDTKPIGDALHQWETDPLTLTVEGDDAYGLGATDMKGAVAAMIVALKRLRDAGDPPGKVSLLLTADEEQGSDAGARALAAEGYFQGDGPLRDVDHILIGEPSGIQKPWEAIYLVSRGICCFEVEIRTHQGHSGLSPALGRNAVLVGADVLHALEDFNPTVDEPGQVPCSPTVNPGIFTQGGVSYGTWPGLCRLGMEVRLVPGMSRHTLDREIRALLDHVVGHSAEWSLRYKENAQGWMPAVEISPQDRLALAAQKATETVFGHELPFAAFPGGTDATYFIGDAGIPSIASLGPGWISVAHGPNEKVGVSQLHDTVDLYLHTISSYFSHSDS